MFWQVPRHYQAGGFAVKRLFLTVVSKGNEEEVTHLLGSILSATPKARDTFMSGSGEFRLVLEPLKLSVSSTGSGFDQSCAFLPSG